MPTPILTLLPITPRTVDIVRSQFFSYAQMDRESLITGDYLEYTGESWNIYERLAQASVPIDQSSLADRALAYYDRELRSKLEPEHDGQYVAIYPETLEYIVEPRFGRSFRAMRTIHPNGPIIVRCIGGSNPLIGMELLSDCLVTLELEGIGGTITIEPNR